MHDHSKPFPGVSEQTPRTNWHSDAPERSERSEFEAAFTAT